MKTRQEIVAEFSQREQSKKLGSVKQKAVQDLKALSPEDKQLVNTLASLVSTHSMAKVGRLLSIISLSEK